MRISDASLDWQKSDTYDYGKNLVHTDWAWEGLRRNRHFQQSWQDARNRFQVLEEHDHLRIIAAPEDDGLTRWGCLYTDAPDCNASDATVIWQPERYSRVLPMAAFTPDGAMRAAPFRLHDLRCCATLLMTPDGLQHLFIGNRGRSFQIAVTGASLLKPAHLLTEAILDPKNGGLRLKSLQCFNDLRATGRLVRSHIPAQPSSPRMRMVIQVLDGALAGVPYRDIAAVLFGKARVEREWDNRNRFLRDRIRRAVKRGRDLMNGGYLKFLR
ncbi:MAG TPA: DUF2285 domain-containing protein [Rhizomicrobium sp.]|nr:DUF2285 domain-containing protein [Rhizomicrobium sp.]